MIYDRVSKPVYGTAPCAPGRPARIDDEYVRNGVAGIFMEVEPLAVKGMWRSLNIAPGKKLPGNLGLWMLGLS